MSVVSDLQNKRILGPTSRQFSPVEWAGQIKRDDVIADDTEIIALGILFYQSFEKLRENLSFVVGNDIPNAVKRRMLIGVANRECLLSEIITIEQLSAEFPKGSTVPIDRIAGMMIDLPGGAFSADEISETVVDGAEKLIRMCPLLNETGSVAEIDVSLRDIVRDVNIANAYLSIESLWMDVIWNEFRIVRGREPMTFVPKDLTNERFRAVSQHRHIITTSQAYSFSYIRNKHKRRKNLSPSRLTSREISARIVDGAVALDLIEAADEKIARKDATRAMAIPGYYAPILDRAGPAHPHLNLNLIFDAFMLLSGLAHSLAKDFIVELKKERAEGDDAVVPLPYLAPPIPRIKILESFSAVLGISIEVAEELTSFLTFGGAPSRAMKGVVDDIWSAPLVQVDQDHVVATTHPLRNANFRWLVDVWLKRLGFPLDFRGTEFEVYARLSLTDACINSAISEVSRFHGSEFKFVTATGREEEIDILAVIGNLVVVGEAKCFLEPIAPIERRNHREKIADAVVQVQRKADAVRGSEREFLARAKQLGFGVPKDYRVIPVVVLNHAIGAGQILQGVSVIDLRIFEMFFEGSMQRMAVVSPDGQVVSSEVEKFFGALNDVDSCFESYLADPPQVRHLRDAIRHRQCNTLFPAVTSDIVVKIQLDIDSATLFETTS